MKKTGIIIAAVAGGAVVLALLTIIIVLLANRNNAPTPPPSIEIPSPTPISEETPVPTPELTPSPTPEPTPQPVAEDYAYYGDFSDVPDFGAFSGFRGDNSESYGTEGESGYETTVYYQGSNLDACAEYGKLLESQGFEELSNYSTREGWFWSYNKGTTYVSISAGDNYTMLYMYIADGIEYYAEFDAVPTFGSISGEPYDEFEEYGEDEGFSYSCDYHYLTAEISHYEEYINLLESHGFEAIYGNENDAFSTVGFIKDNIYVRVTINFVVEKTFIFAGYMWQ